MLATLISIFIITSFVGSRPDEVNEFIFFNLPNPFGRTKPRGSPRL
jgi:hypothetical protein